MVQKKLPGESKINQKFSDANLTNEQEIFLLFIKQNVDLVGGTTFKTVLLQSELKITTKVVFILYSEYI